MAAFEHFGVQVDSIFPQRRQEAAEAVSFGLLAGEFEVYRVGVAHEDAETVRRFAVAWLVAFGRVYANETDGGVFAMPEDADSVAVDDAEKENAKTNRAGFVGHPGQLSGYFAGRGGDDSFPTIAYADNIRLVPSLTSLTGCVRPWYSMECAKCNEDASRQPDADSLPNIGRSEEGRRSLLCAWRGHCDDSGEDHRRHVSEGLLGIVKA